MAIKREHTPQNDDKKRHVYKITAKRAKITGIMCLVIICVVLIFMSPIFRIKTIVVNPGEYLETETVLKAVGFDRGENIFSIDISKAVKEVEKLDRVGSCIIERTLPGKVTVTVNDTLESGYIKLDTGYAGIDESGKVVTVANTPEHQAPVISGIKVSDAQKGDYIKIEEKNAKVKSDFLVRLLTSLKEHSLVSEAKQINLSDMKKVSLVLVTDTIVEFGSDGDSGEDRIEYKVACLRAVLNEEYPEARGILDISNTDSIRFKAN